MQRKGMPAWAWMLLLIAGAVHAQDPDAFEPDGSAALATALPVRAELRQQTIAPAGDVDWMRVPLEAGRLYEIGAIRTPPDYNTPRTGARLRVDLYDRDGRTLLLSRSAAQRGDVVGFEVRLTRDFPGRPSGDYFVRVSALDGTTGTYGVTVAAYENDGTPAAAPMLDLGAIPQIHVLSDADDVDHQRVLLTRPAAGQQAIPYQILAFPDAGARLRVELFDDAGLVSGVPVAEGESFSAGRVAQASLPEAPATGAYTVRVSALDGDIGAYAVQVFSPSAPDSGRLVGEVRDALGAVAYAAVVVRAAGSNDVLSGDLSGEDGRFRIPVNPGQYVVSASKDGFLPSAEATVDVPAGDEGSAGVLLLAPEVTVAAPDAANTRILGAPGLAGATVATDLQTNGAETSLSFRFQPVAQPGFTLFEQQQRPDAAAPQSVSTQLADLRCGTAYQVQVTASNSAGSDSDATAFTTAACPPLPPGLENLIVQPNPDGTAAFTVGVATNGADTSLSFEYRSGGGAWIAVGAQQVPAGPGVQVRGATTGALACGTEYAFRALAGNSAGNTTAGPQGFRSFACPPVTLGAAAVLPQPFAATLTGTADTFGIGGSGRFELRLASAIDWQPAGSAGLLAMEGSQVASLGAAGLECGTAYRMRFRAETAAGTGDWIESPFSTAACPPPTIVASGNAPPSLFDIRLTARIASNGLPFTAAFEHRPVGAPTFTVSAQARPASPAQQDLTRVVEWRCGQSYEYRVVASGVGGTVSTPTTVVAMPACGLDFISGSGFEG